jgi:hypothetical protein
METYLTDNKYLAAYLIHTGASYLGFSRSKNDQSQYSFKLNALIPDLVQTYWRKGRAPALEISETLKSLEDEEEQFRNSSD